MNTETVQTTHWRSNILIILAILGAILLALILAQLDNLNELIQPLPTAVSQLPIDTTPEQPTPLPSLTPIPTNTSTPVAEELTPTATATPSGVLPGCGQVPSGWLPYVVQPGDTLSSLSIRSGASMEAIAYANCLEMGQLIAGTVIYLPATPIVLPPCGAPPYWIIYTVQYGDTLYSLANRTGTTVYKIMHANCLTHTYIYAGQSLYLPSYPVVPPTAMPTMLPTAIGTITSTPPMTTTATATPTGTILPTTTATATATGTLMPTITATPTLTGTPPATAMPTSLPTVTSTGQPTSVPTGIPTLPPPTSMPTAYPSVPAPTLPPPPTAYP